MKFGIYEGAERTRQVMRYIRQQKAQGADNRKVLEDTRAFNDAYNDPPLPDAELKHAIDIMNAIQNTKEPYKATSLVTKDGKAISKYDTRTVTLSSGRKITMRGAEIIDLE